MPYFLTYPRMAQSLRSWTGNLYEGASLPPLNPTYPTWMTRV